MESINRQTNRQTDRNRQTHRQTNRWVYHFSCSISFSISENVMNWTLNYKNCLILPVMKLNYHVLRKEWFWRFLGTSIHPSIHSFVHPLSGYTQCRRVVKTLHLNILFYSTSLQKKKWSVKQVLVILKKIFPFSIV